MKRTTRRAGAVGAVLLLMSACSHTTPYHRDPVVSPTARPAADTITFSLLLIGDAGEPQPTEPVLDSLRRWTDMAPERTLVVFLGDNVYPEGVTSAREADAAQRLRRQLDAVGEAAALFVPGNHDWANGGAEGHAAIMRQEAFVEPEAAFLPNRGCPGPEVLDLPASGSPVARLVVLDTQWWLHNHEKPTVECAYATPAAVVTGLIDALGTSLPVVVVAHHPLATHGAHGGFFDWRDHLFPATRWDPLRWLWLPLPGVGSLYPLLRWNVFRSDQDLIGGGNRAMREALASAFAARDRPDAGPLVYAAGHDHGLQILEGRHADYVLVSGLGSSTKATGVGHSDDTLFAHEHPGFMALDITAEQIWLSVVEPVGETEEVVVRLPLHRRLR